MRVLVTGSGGQLGAELMEMLPGAGHEAVGLDLPELDIAAEGAARAALGRVRPRAVINCAAWTRVDAAEAEREAAFRVNATGPALLASACAEVGARLLHLSTDFVFDGSAREPIPEAAAPHPLNVYGESKLAGEEAVRAALPESHCIVRTAWLYGRGGPNFVLTMLRLAGAGRELRVVADQWGSPTWTGHLAPALISLVEAGRCGLYHLSGGGVTSWHGFAAAIVEEAGLGVPVVPVTTEQYPTPARRPAFSGLDNRRWTEEGMPPLPPWREGLRRYLRQLDVIPA